MGQTIFGKTARAPAFSMGSSTFSVRRFPVADYHLMGEVGILGEDDRVELIDGRILEMSPIGSLHAACVSFLNRRLRPVEETAIVRVEDLVVLNDETEPQPDIAVVRFKENLYADAHPQPEDVLLISCMPSKGIDQALYPDIEPPERLESFSARVDFLARLCAAWDFGILPDDETVREIRRPAWGEAVEACRLLTSPAYHLLRQWHDLAPLPYLGQRLAYIAEDPNLSHV